jgi:hypothetical protein
MKKTFGKWAVEINGNQIKITDGWSVNWGTVYKHIKKGDLDNFKNQKYPAGFDFEIPRKDIKIWIEKTIFNKSA